MAKPIGLLGGTFDPVHHGHLRLALEVLDRAELDHVRLVPVCKPPHHKHPVASAEQRREMLHLAIKDVNRLQLEDCELERGGISYTIDTLKELKSRLPGSNLCLIMGMDALQSLHSWRLWHAIPETAHIVVVERPGGNTPEMEPEIAAWFEEACSPDPAVLRESEAGGILNIRIPQMDISSTRLRHMFAQGRDARFLLPSPVLEFICHEKLYDSEQT